MGILAFECAEIYILTATVLGRWRYVEIKGLLWRIIFVSAVLGTVIMILEKFMFSYIKMYRYESLAIAGCGGFAYMVTQGKIKLGKKEDEKCRVCIWGDLDKKYDVEGIVDSGNFLKEPISERPVCVINKEILPHVFDGSHQNAYRVIPYSTVEGKRKIMEGYHVKKIQIRMNGMEKNVEDIYLGVIDSMGEEGGYQMILPQILLK